MAYILSSGVAEFGDRREGLGDLLAEASHNCLDGVDEDVVDDLVVANALGGEMGEQTGVSNYLSSRLGLNCYSRRVGQTSASGAAAVYDAYRMVESGVSDAVLVAAGEKMTGLDTAESSDVISTVTHPSEYRQGVTMPAFAGLVARTYLDETQATRHDLARVAVENHANAVSNPAAQFHRQISVDDVVESPLIAHPLRLYDFCPTTDGAASILVASEKVKQQHSVSETSRISGMSGASDTHAVHDRETVLSLDAAKKSSEEAYHEAGVSVDDIDVLEVHDMFTALELIQLEDLGIYARGEGWRYVREKPRICVNPSGGLKARGHPLAATGVAQILELHRQITRDADDRQITDDAEIGVACNLAGYGNAAITTVVEET